MSIPPFGRGFSRHPGIPTDVVLLKTAESARAPIGRGDRNAITILIYDQGMPVTVTLQTVHSRTLAAVRREVAPGAVGSAWGPAVGKVWPFIRSQPGLWTDGHNIFLYHHPTQPGAPILCDFGVEVTRTFETAGEVYVVETPGGEAAIAVHRGPYSRVNEAHEAIRKWMEANRRGSAGHSWEVYGDARSSRD